MKKAKKRKEQGFFRKTVTGAVAGILALSMAVGLMQPATDSYAAGKTTNIEGFSAALIADPDTSETDHIFNASPAEDGKIWTDKTVTTGAIYGISVGEENFGIALSALAQTYNTVETTMSSEQTNIAYDVVFVLDFSGSMNDRTGNNNTPYKAQAMVDALNPAIATLMENEYSRLAVVGYSGTSTAADNATTLLGLDHYSTTNVTTDGGEIYFTYSSNNDRISIASGVKNQAGQTQSGNKTVTGGTPTQRGIYHGFSLLNSAQKPDDDVVRIPIIVLLTDGEAGSAYSNYRNMSGTRYQGSANGSSGSSSYNDEVGAYTALTANYVKDELDTLYKSRYDNYDGIDDAGAKFYTIGLGISEDSWAEYMLDPDPNTTTSAGTATNLKNYLNSDATYGNGNYDYADKYYGGTDMSDEDLKEAFADILEQMKVSPQISNTVNDPITTTGGGGAANTKITFTDYLGYKMELKGDSQYLRYGSVNYRFDKTADSTDEQMTFVFSGYDLNGTTASGPVITKGEETFTLNDVVFTAEWQPDLEINGQTGYWKVTFSFPSALMPTYSRANDYDSVNVDPIRMLYEVGLEEDTDLQNDSLKIDANGALTANEEEVAQYVFHTNLADYATGQNGLPKAMTTVEYTPAPGNPYYYKTGYTPDQDLAGTTEKYIRLDVVATTTKMEEITGTADISLTNITLNPWYSRAIFTYNGQEYQVALTGDRTNGELWTGDVSIPVTATTVDGQSISTEIAVRVTGVYNNYNLSLSAVTISGESAVISGTTATLNGLEISKQVETTEESLETVPVYMELEGDAANGYYVTDAKGNEIPVTTEGNLYKVVLGENTYYSTTYYKYADNKPSYIEKKLPKGTEYKSFVGQLVITQPEDGEITSTNFDEVFTYKASNGKTYKAERVYMEDGTLYGSEPAEAIDLVEGTINICIEDIENAQGDHVHFDFVVERQQLSDGTVRYVASDCYYWDDPADPTAYTVDISIAEIADIDEDAKTYSYDVSYSIESVNDNTEDAIAGNVTVTDPHFLETEFYNEDGTVHANGAVNAHLGNNGRISVDIDDAYDADITVKKEWRERLGELLDNNSDLLKDVSITVGLFQEYSYRDAAGNLVEQTGSEGVPIATAELNQVNNFTHTWERPSLPEYLVNSGGEYVLDGSGERVPVTYTVSEIIPAAGWVADEELIVEGDADNGVITYTLTNVPITDFTPSVTKVWMEDGQEVDAPEGYKVQVELLADGEPLSQEDVGKLDTEHPVITTLEQQNAESGATLNVSFGETELAPVAGTTNEIGLEEFASASTITRSFEYTESVGEMGTGTHAHSAIVTITVSNTGDKLRVTDATVTYHYTDMNTQEAATATLRAHNSVREEVSDTTSKVTFLMSYPITEASVITLDGTEEVPWTHVWEDWHLPLLTRDENGEYRSIVYSVKESLIIEKDGTRVEPDEETGFFVTTEGVFVPTVEGTASYEFTLTNEKNVRNLTAAKVWVDNNNKYGTRPDSITFKVKADGTEVPEYEQTFTSSDTTGVWNGTKNVEWSGIPKYNDDRTEIVYTIEETMEWSATEQKAEYTTTVDADAATPNHYIVTNSIDTEKNLTSVDVTKTWIDNANAYQTRPQTLYMVLYRMTDGSAVEEVAPAVVPITFAADAENLQGRWSDLPKYNEEGKQYIYFVREYDSADNHGESFVAGYSTSVSPATPALDVVQYDFTNTLEAGEIAKTVTKVWKDKALESERPEEITVQLSGTIATEEGVVTVDLDPNSDETYLVQKVTAPSWSHTWTGLPEYSEGIRIDYTIKETYVGNDAVTTDETSGEEVAGKYVVTTTDDGEGNEFTVTNTLTDTTVVTVEKEWDLTEAPEGFTVPTVTFDIYRNLLGNTGETLVVENGSATASKELPKYNSEGETIIYTVVENPIEGNDTYKFTTVVGDNEGTEGNFKYTATNTYVPLVKDISGTKTWEGVTDENIPESITVGIYQGNATEAYETQVVTAESGWTYTFTNLPIYEADGATEHQYSVKEIMVGTTTVSDEKAGDYEVTVNGYDIINKLTGTVAGVDIEGSKRWILTGNSEAVVPDSMKVQLMRSIDGVNVEEALDVNGKEVIITVTGTETEWNFNFEGYTLPKYDASGNEYIYSVKEISVTANGTELPVEDGSVGDYTVETGAANEITNTRDNETTSYVVTKEWAVPEGTTLPGSITIELYRQAGNAEAELVTEDASGNAVLTTLTAEDGWTHTFTNLPKYAEDGVTEYAYSVVETKVGSQAVVDIDGQLKAGDYIVTITNDKHSALIVNGYAAELLDVIVTKEWVGAADQPDAISVQLYQGETALEEEKILNAENNWSYTYSNLPKHNSNGDKYTYTVKEVSVTADGHTENVIETTVENVTTVTVGDYTVTYTSKTETGNIVLGITNTMNNEKVDVTYPLTKKWVVPEGTTLPNDITIELYRQAGSAAAEKVTEDASGNKVLTTLTGSGNTWTYTFENLQKFSDANGIVPYEYFVKETAVGAVAVNNNKAGAFAVSYEQQDENGTIIVNTLGDETVDIPVRKEWSKTGEALPESITVALYQDGAETAYATQRMTAENNWEYTFSGLPKYKADNLTEHSYSVKETHIGDVPVVSGEAAAYTVSNPVLNNGIYVITNTLEEVTTSIEVTKAWNGIDEAKRPAEIVIELHGGPDVLRKTLSKSDYAGQDAWKCTFEDVPVYEPDGITPYVYTVKEASVTPVAGGTPLAVIYNGNTGSVGDYTVTLDQESKVITNTLDSGKEKTTYTITKNWVVPSAGAKLPENITVELYRQAGTATPELVKTEVITGSGLTWTYTFTDLQKYTEDGITEYVYSVVETHVGGVAVENNTVGAFTVSTNGNVITNTAELTLDLYTSLTVEKKWEGVTGDNIPEYIVLELYREGETEAYRTQSVNGTGTTWTYTFENLPRYIDGVREYQYYVRETQVAGQEGFASDGKIGDYEVTQSGNTITNTLTGTVEVSGKKVWDDSSNADDKRPANITVELYQSIEGGTAAKIDEKEVNGSGDEWAFTFDNAGNGYPKYDPNGNKYVYTVKEQGEADGLYSIMENGEISHQYRVTYDQETLTITNTVPNVETAVISGKKTMSGRGFKDTDQFTFLLTPITANAPMPANSTVTVQGIKDAESLAVSFGEITYTKEGTYQYEVSEEKPAEGDRIGGVTYDENRVLVVVTVNYSPQEEKYVATVVYNNSEESTGFVFENRYQAASVTEELSVTKVLNGRELGEEEFEFELEAVGNAPMPTVKTAKNAKPAEGKTEGVVTFEPILFDKAGVYEYVISEIEPAEKLSGVTYDKEKITATVTVSDDWSGQLKVTSVKYEKADESSDKFVNTYATTPVGVALEGQKTVEDASGAYVFNAGDFSFIVKADETNPASDPYKQGATVKNTITEANGSKIGKFVIFTEDKKFTEAGTYQYVITEAATSIPGIHIDNSSYQVTVTVKDNLQGALVPEVKIQKTKDGKTADAPVVAFNNVYDPTVATATIRGTKQLSGRELKANEFEFVLEAADDMAKKVLPEAKHVKNAQSGEFAFDTLTFKEVGSYRFKVTEVQGSLDGVTYDKSEYIVVIEVTGEEVKVETQEPSENGEPGTTAPPEEGGEATTPPEEGGEATTPPEEGGEATTPPEEGGETTTPPEEGGEATTPPEEGGETTTPPEEGGEATTPPEEGGEATTPPEEGGETTAPPEEGGEATTPPEEGGETTTPPEEGGETTTPPEEGGEATTPQAGDEAIMPTQVETTPETPAEETDPLQDENLLLNMGLKLNVRQLLVTGASGAGEPETPAKEGTVNTGALHAKVTILKNDKAVDAIVFNNSYVPDKVVIGKGTKIPLKGSKTLSGRAMNAGEFEFELIPGDKAYPMPKDATVSNAADGSFEFGTITFDKEGIYYYTIVENKNGISGIEYDESSYTVEVEVTDDGKGKLHAAVVCYNEDGKETAVAFKNAYSAAPTSLHFTVAKELKGRKLKIGEFEFEIEAVTKGAPMPASAKVKNDANGIAVFEEIKFTAAGDYTYKVKEVKGSVANVTYDTKVYEIIVHVTDDLKGQLVASLDKSFTGIKFVNEYQVPEKPKAPETPDEPTPTPAPTPIGAPKTGDLNNLMLWIAVAFVAAGGFVVSKRKK